VGTPSLRALLNIPVSVDATQAPRTDDRSLRQLCFHRTLRAQHSHQLPLKAPKIRLRLVKNSDVLRSESMSQRIMLEAFRPCSVRGPVLSRALRRLASICKFEVIADHSAMAATGSPASGAVAFAASSSSMAGPALIAAAASTASRKTPNDCRQGRRD
jgi:hypothetical protein